MTGLRQRSGAPGRMIAAWHTSAEPQRLLSQALFRDALARERRRADRFEEAFVLVVVSFASRALPPWQWSRLADALSRQYFDADVIGWLEQGSAIGVIRSVAGSDGTDVATALAHTLEREVVRCLAPDQANGCSCRLEVYSPHGEQVPAVFLDGESEDRRPTLRRAARDAAKRALDIFGSAALLLVFSPVFLCVSILVKLTSKGPALFRQQRVGKAGRPFTMLKFRSMYVNVDHAIHKHHVEMFIQPDRASGSTNDVVFKLVADPRVTRVGRFLRRSSFDELPQFWNVLRGDMSLVGPRPALSYELARYKRWHRRRLLQVKPGITGLWQVSGRSRTTFDEMVRLDLRYARSCSLWTDLKILLATPRAVVSGTGAR